MTVSEAYIQNLQKVFATYKSLGEKTLAQLDDYQVNFTPNIESNSIEVIVKHISGNMLSRFTDFYTSDGEKEWRNRDSEFEPQTESKEEVIARWNKGWDCFLFILDNLKEEDLLKIVTIRSEPHTVIDALNRQLAHYSYHIGQMVYIAKMVKDSDWKTLSIARNKSKEFNDGMMKGN